MHFAQALRHSTRQLLVFTPAYNVAIALAGNPLIQVMQLPGQFCGEEGVVHGPETVAAIGRFRAPLAVLGVSGIDAQGPSEAMLAAAQVYSTMMLQSERVLLLADASKFGKRALCALCDWKAHIHLVVDTLPEALLLEAIRAGEAMVSVAE